MVACVGPAAGCTSKSGKREYVRSLLTDIDRAAAEALLREVRP